MLRKRQVYVEKFGQEAGGRLYHALQSQAAHAGVSARLRRKLAALERGEAWPPARPRDASLPLPLFPDLDRSEVPDQPAITSVREAAPA